MQVHVLSRVQVQVRAQVQVQAHVQAQVQVQVQVQVWVQVHRVVKGLTPCHTSIHLMVKGLHLPCGREVEGLWYSMLHVTFVVVHGTWT